MILPVRADFSQDHEHDHDQGQDWGKRASLLLHSHRMGCDAFPFAVAEHPGVGEPISVAKVFAGLGFAGFLREACHDRDVIAVHPHLHVAGDRGSVGVGIALRFREQGRLVALLAARRSANEIVRHDLLNDGGVLTQEGAFPT